MSDARGPDANQLPRVLGPTEALCVVVGSVIGSGIFLVPAKVAAEVPSIAGIAALWVLGGLFSLAGALTLAELGAMLPRAGGPYVYLRAAYGPLVGFLFGWTEFLVIRAGSIATLASACALYAAQPQLLPPPGGLDHRIWEMILAVAAMAGIAVINVVGTRVSGSVQVVGTALKVGALVAIVVLPFALGRASVGRLSPVWPAAFDRHLFGGMMAAIVGVLWAYDGWVNTSSLGEEIRDPGRNIPRALVWGMAILIAIYMSVTLAYHLVLPMDQVAAGADATRGSGREVAAVFMRTLLGPAGGLAIALVVVCSTLISLNGNALSGPRAYFAMARDGLFPRALCRVHPRFQTPANAIVAQAAWGILLTVSATLLVVVRPPGEASGLPSFLVGAWGQVHRTPLYDILYTYVIFGGTVLYSLTIASVFVLRRTHPDLPRPYRTWGYPVTPLLYIAASLLLIQSMLQRTPFESMAGLGLIGLGVPAYFFFSRRGKAAPVAETLA